MFNRMHRVDRQCSGKTKLLSRAPLLRSPLAWEARPMRAMGDQGWKMEDVDQGLLVQCPAKATDRTTKINSRTENWEKGMQSS